MLPMMAMAHAVGSSKKKLTIGNSGASYGWREIATSYGSLEPLDGGTGIEMPNAPGEYIVNVYTVTTGGADLTVLGDTPGASQTDFTSIFVQDGTGAIRQYDTATADGFNATNPSWFWGDGTDDVFDNTSSGEVRVVWVV